LSRINGRVSIPSYIQQSCPRSQPGGAGSIGRAILPVRGDAAPTIFENREDLRQSDWLALLCPRRLRSLRKLQAYLV